jgi:predicted pyridoxine 5'-phosphate oxidase superfamily flavin-nucleotide-binding protein
MDRKIQKIIKQSSCHALATSGPHGINVVPVSVVEVYGNEIHLYDFFMRKTAENIKAEPRVALTSWREFTGVQIKATAVYETEGPAFEGAVLKMGHLFPDRTLHAVIRLTPTEVYDVAPGADPDDLLR